MIEEARGRGKLDLCAFCREPKPTSDEEKVKQIKKLAEAGNGDAFYALAGFYDRGIKGMPQDIVKANELYLQAGELGCPEGYCNLGYSYEHGEGAEVDKKKAKHFYELAAMNGTVAARHNLGYMEVDAGNYHRAYKHFILAAKAGDKKSLDVVKEGYMDDMVTKGEYANTLRAYHQRYDEMTSDARDRAEEAYRNLTPQLPMNDNDYKE